MPNFCSSISLPFYAPLTLKEALGKPRNYCVNSSDEPMPACFFMNCSHGYEVLTRTFAIGTGMYSTRIGAEVPLPLLATRPWGAKLVEALLQLNRRPHHPEVERTVPDECGNHTDLRNMVVTVLRPGKRKLAPAVYSMRGRDTSLIEDFLYRGIIYATMYAYDDGYIDLFRSIFIQRAVLFSQHWSKTMYEIEKLIKYCNGRLRTHLSSIRKMVWL